MAGNQTRPSDLILHLIEHGPDVMQLELALVVFLQGMQLASGDAIRLDAILLGMEGVHIADEGLCGLGR
jgi:hypothetical protein